MIQVAGIQAVVLAGGLGTRLQSVVANHPKCVAPISGRPFLCYLLDRLESEGVRSAILCSGYRADAIRGVIGQQHGKLALEYSRESKPLGTAGALRLARRFMRSDPVITLNGDSFCNVSLKSVIDFHCQTRAQATIVIVEVPDAGRFGRVLCDDSGTVLEFVEKSDGGRGWINAGVYVLSQSFLDQLPVATPLSFERDVLPAWIGRGLFAHKTTARFIDIGTPESYQRAEQFFAEPL